MQDYICVNMSGLVNSDEIFVNIEDLIKKYLSRPEVEIVPAPSPATLRED